MIFFTHSVQMAVYTVGLFTALYGFGLLAGQCASYTHRQGAINLTIGLGFFIFCGGIFNLLHIAYGWVFDILIVVGIVIFILKRKAAGLNWPGTISGWGYWGILALFILGIMVFTIATQFPPQAYNYHDDLEKYFAHPVRMLQTGTLLGSPLSAIGSETIGGQAVLHGIILNHFPIVYLNGADAVWGLGLCLIVSMGLGRGNAKSLPIALISLAMVLVINPQYVNVSAFYTAIALMMTAFILSSGNGSDHTDALPPPLMMGLIYAGMVALKSSLVLFPVIHFSFHVITYRLHGLATYRLLRWGIGTTAYSLLFLSPWLLLHLPHYIRSASQFQDQAPFNDIQFPNLFSWEPLYYGSSFAHYTILCMANILFVGGIIRMHRRAHNALPSGIQAAMIANGATVVTSYFFIIAIGPLLNGYTTNLRYAVPYIIAATPILFGVVCHAALKKDWGGSKTILGAFLTVGLFILISFTNSFSDRIRQAYNYRTTLAFSQFATSSNYLTYNQYVLNGEAQSRIKAIQTSIPPGAEIIAWIKTPFYLDYKRNIIYDAEPAGLANPWAHIPQAEYVMYEYRGFAVRPYTDFIARLNAEPGRHERQIAQRCLVFLNFLHAIRSNADEIYNDGKIVVYKINL